MQRQFALRQLIEMSHRLGDPAREYVILGEGNTSARASESTFLVKASGFELGSITAQGFVEVDLAAILTALDAGDLTDEQVKERLLAARVQPEGDLRPSVETFLHALLLDLPGVEFVGHTHPTSVNTVLCSKRGPEAISGRLFPDEIVCCGIAPAYVPYTDPGVPLARAVKAHVQAYLDEHEVAPRAILMQNHGIIAAGKSPAEVESVTHMWDKVAKVLIGTYALGGPVYMTAEHVARIYTRPDEKYREKLIADK
ncbi:MAG: class II aldolase/adducin family protein [Armatimonadota bacterium]